MINTVCVVLKECVNETYLFRPYLKVCFKHEFVCVSARNFAEKESG